jgi:TonB family protein
VAGRRFPLLTWLIVLAGVFAWAGLGGSAERDDSAPGRLYALSLPAQPLEPALAAFAEQTGVQILYETALTRERQAAAVEGTYPADVALGLLLRDSGLGYRRTVVDGFTLVSMSHPAPPGPFAPPESDAPSELGAATRRFASFFGVMQAGLITVLCREPATRPDRLRTLVVRLWFDPSGTIVGVDLEQGSGDRERDRAIVAALRRQELGAPVPREMPQPVTVAIGGGGGGDGCSPKL